MLDKTVKIVVELKDKLSTNLDALNKKVSGFNNNLKETKMHLLALSSVSTMAFTKAMNDALQYGDSIETASQQTGMAVETLQKLLFVFQQNNMDINNLTIAFQLYLQECKMR